MQQLLIGHQVDHQVGHRLSCRPDGETDDVPDPVMLIIRSRSVRCPRSFEQPCRSGSGRGHGATAAAAGGVAPVGDVAPAAGGVRYGQAAQRGAGNQRSARAGWRGRTRLRIRDLGTRDSPRGERPAPINGARPCSQPPGSYNRPLPGGMRQLLRRRPTSADRWSVTSLSSAADRLSVRVGPSDRLGFVVDCCQRIVELLGEFRTLILRLCRLSGFPPLVFDLVRCLVTEGRMETLMVVP